MDVKITAENVINALFNPNEIVNIRIFDDKKLGTFQGMKLSVEAGKYKTIEEQLIQHNKLNRSISFVVNSGGNKDSEITKINACFVENDTDAFDVQQKRIDEFKLKPSMIIKTRKSLHTYWFAKDVPVNSFRPIQKALIEHFNGDGNCVNESRCLRLPGFMHCKETPIEVTCIVFNPELRYSVADFVDALPTIKFDETARPKVEHTSLGSETGLQIVCAECDFIKHCETDAATLPEHDWYAMISNLAIFEGGAKTIHEYSKTYPTYSEEVTNQKIQHFLDSGTRPITCQIIADKGYICPKMQDGTCKCKSPAALCYKPMSTDGLNIILNKLPISDEPLTNINTVTVFIRNYLFNQESAIATTFIRHNIKFYFSSKETQQIQGMPTSKLKPLFDTETIKSFVEFYREQHKIYKQGLDVKKARVGDMDIPEWYEPVGRGLKFMPKVLAKHLKDTEQVFFAAESHYIYNNGVYKHLEEMDALKMVQDKMLDTEAKMSQISDAGQQWKMQVHKEMKELNPNPYIINIKNGLYNVIDGTLKEHSPSYISTVQLNVTKSPDADCPRFKEFLLNAMEGDAEQVKLIQEMLGYFLIPTNAAQKCFVIVGVAAAGKSVLLRVINEILLGKENVSNVAWQALNERFKTAELFGKLANIFSDLPTKNIDDNGIFKALVGEDFLTVEKKNKNPFSFQSYARLLFSCNSIPKNYGDKSEGFYRKLIIIRFNKSIPENERDPELLSKFAMEADGIFNFALLGLKELINNKFKFHVTDKNKQELQQYREDSDSILLFVKECCAIGSQYQCGSTELYNAYKAFCEESGLKPYAQRTFVTFLKSQYPNINTERINGHGVRQLLGIGIIDEAY